MSGVWSKKVEDPRKPFPGCMGRMINIFDLSAGMPGTKLLTDRPYRDGSLTRRNWPEGVKKASNTMVEKIEDKPVVSELKKSFSGKKSGGTPMKMLIAQEMSRETDSKRKPPSVVAKLMGLDALPAQQQDLSSRRSLQEGYSRNTLGGLHRGNQPKEDGYFTDPCMHENDYKDVYEVRQQPSRKSRSREQSPQRGTSNDNLNEKRMALVRQKFMEAKRLATDEKLLQSKEFQDALEVLSSNRDLFLRFLEEPNSLFSKQLNELQAIPPTPQTKRIAVLKPLKMVEMKDEKQVKKQQYPAPGDYELDTEMPYRTSSFGCIKAENHSVATRIVVLKPSNGKPHDVKAMIGSPISSPKLSEERGVCKDLEGEEALGSREVAREITRQMKESISSNRRDDSLLSSLFSNGYVGDDSSFNRSENEFIEECGNFSDSEIVTPTSRHSWDYINNRFGSPYSLSSISRTSYSPESSVIKEAKKRLSERWAMMASNGGNQEQRQVRRSSSTLGEMLAMPEVKKEEESDKQPAVLTSRSFSAEEDIKASEACLPSGNETKDVVEERSSSNLSRSKSVPVSSSIYENFELNMKASESLGSNGVLKNATKSKSGKSSFKGKVSSLFFSKNKKIGGEKSLLSPSAGTCSISESNSVESVGKSRNDSPRSVHNSLCEDSPVATPTVACDRSKPSNSSLRDILSLEKPAVFDGSNENQDHLSPNSVLQAPFEDDTHSCVPQSSQSICAVRPQDLCRSTPIESLTRTLSWDEVPSETSPPNHLKSFKALPKANDEEKEQEQIELVQKLLSLSGLDCSTSSMVLSKWHSPDSPLDPMLLDKFLDRKEEEAKCRERRSNQRLLFDCVNTALIQISQAAIFGAHPRARAFGEERRNVSLDVPLVNEVCRMVRNWFSDEEKWTAGEMENGSAVVDRVVRREVGGRGWSESIWWEMDEIGKEIGEQVLDELVGEALVDLSGRCL